MRKAIATLSLILMASGATQVRADEDGKAMFAGRCSACHQISGAGSGSIGPSLKGVYRRKIASLPGFDYSPALKAKRGRWTAANLDVFLSGPSVFAPGTRMPITVASAADRKVLIGYLKTAK